MYFLLTTAVQQIYAYAIQILSEQVEADLHTIQANYNILADATIKLHVSSLPLLTV